MAGVDSSDRDLQQTPTWAVAAVFFVLILVSVFIEQTIHFVGKWLKKKHKRALYESLEKLKSELMMMGFISLLLTIVQKRISEICIPQSAANTWHPCKSIEVTEESSEGHSSSNDEEGSIGRRLLWSSTRRILAGGDGGKCHESKGKISLISTDGIHQLHIFIFVLAAFHVLYCIITLALGRAKMRRWKSWEKETRTVEYQFTHDPERFRFARETSFGRRHLKVWSSFPVLVWIVCFFRQFFRSVIKADYLTLRHGFIMAHLARHSSTQTFDFQKYINRSLEEDFKVVVGISPMIWIFAILFILASAHGSYASLWLPFIPLLIVLLVGTKLQVIITQMGLKIQDRGDVVKGVPLVQPADHLFWFNRPQLILFLIHLVVFQNAFQMALFAWAWFEFGIRSCFHKEIVDLVVRLSVGVITQFLCSYVTLPLYALVTQMGSNFKPTIFNEKVAVALKNWHHTARKNVKDNRRSGSASPFSPSRPGTPPHGLSSPVHLRRYHRGESYSPQASPRLSYSENDIHYWDPEGSSPPPSYQHNHQASVVQEKKMEDKENASTIHSSPTQHAAIDQYAALDISLTDFSFAKG